MKKVLLLGILAFGCSQVFANLQQGAWRWRADDGSETSATWLANENVAPPAITSMENKRLRIEIYNVDITPSYQFDNNVLEYSTTGTDPWTSITSTSTSTDWVLAGSSPYVTDLEPTTNQLSGTGEATAYTFVPGFVFVSSDTFSFELAPEQKTEFEWVIKPTATTQLSSTYYFRLSGGVDYDNEPFPQLTTGATLPINLTSFNVQADGQRVKLLWTTASEQNNERFEILRSANGKDNWQVIGTQKGSGTTTQSHTYTAYDEHPLNGLNYYRIKQYDLDGKSKESVIRSVSMQLIKAIISAYPNPTKGPINFTINNYKGSSVTAILSDMKGSVMHKEVVQVNAAVSNYILHVNSKPAPGMYVLQLKGDNLNQSINIVVQ